MRWSTGSWISGGSSGSSRSGGGSTTGKPTGPSSTARSRPTIPMGVHHAWGRTYKDVFQRYKAMCGFDQRYQNGFDCQGLWLEVETEKDLGFNSKRDIENYGLDEFSRACRARVDRFSAIQTEQSHPPGAVDALGRLLLHDGRHEHRVHLALSEDLPGEGLALRGAQGDALVHAMRNESLAARAGRRLRRDHRHLGLPSLPAPRTARASRFWSGRRRRGR